MNPKFKDILHYWTPDKYSPDVWYRQLRDLEVQLQENLCKQNSIETYSKVDEVIVKMELLLLSDMYCTSIIPLYLKEKSDKIEEHLLQLNLSVPKRITPTPGVQLTRAGWAHTVLNQSAVIHFQSSHVWEETEKVWGLALRRKQKNTCPLLDSFPIACLHCRSCMPKQLLKHPSTPKPKYSVFWSLSTAHILNSDMKSSKVKKKNLHIQLLQSSAVKVAYLNTCTLKAVVSQWFI